MGCSVRLSGADLPAHATDACMHLQCSCRAYAKTLCPLNARLTHCGSHNSGRDVQTRPLAGSLHQGSCSTCGHLHTRGPGFILSTVCSARRLCSLEAVAAGVLCPPSLFVYHSLAVALVHCKPDLLGPPLDAISPCIPGHAAGACAQVVPCLPRAANRPR